MHHFSARKVRYVLLALGLSVLSSAFAGAQLNAVPGQRPIGNESNAGKVVNMDAYEHLCAPEKLCRRGFAMAMQDARAYFKMNPTLT